MTSMIKFVERRRTLQPKQRGTVRFETQPHGARITVDGQILINPDTEESIKTPATVLLMEGTRKFTLELENHYPVSGDVEVFAGTKVNIFRNLEPIPGSNVKSGFRSGYSGYDTEYHTGYYNLKGQQYAVGRGDILIDSTPRGAYIYIDDYPFLDDSNNQALTPAKAIGVMEGQHMIQISLDGYYSKKIIVDVIPDKLNIAYAKLQKISD